MIRFPELEREDTMELPVVALNSGLLGAVVSSFSKIVGLIILVPCFLIFLNSIRISISNTIIRRQWAQSFTRRLASRRLKALVKSEPTRHILYVRYFGGFDRANLTPVAILNDQTTDDLIAIHPARWRAIKICEQAVLQVIST